jgi:glycosyltransferase involved in cell wall biosynthesis
MEVHQALPTLDFGDAISNHVRNIQKVLKKNGFESEIYADITHTIFKKTKNYKELKNTEGIILYHFSIGSHVNDFVNMLPNKKVLVYHNITPAEYFIGYSDYLAYLSGWGREQLGNFKNNVIAAWGDSEYNRKELLKFGFRNTAVLPILVDFKKFKNFNRRIYENFNDGATNIIFVGRVIPNKKFDDLIKVFYYYNRYMDRASRLILVGSYHGTELYHQKLLQLAKKLKVVNSVVFTGKVSEEELSAYYRVANTFLCMSEHEGFCVPLLESMFFKIPIVAYSSTAVPYTLGRSGIIFKKKNYEEIAELINLLNTDKSLRKKVVDSQNKRLREFRPEKIERKLITLLKNMM